MLELMINSVYTNKEIFLRELISNASDALDKLHFISLTAQDKGLPVKYKIEISADKAARTLTISDNGVGMSETELEANLGTIAKSGTYAVKSQAAAADDTPPAPKGKGKSTKPAKAEATPDSLIGQFGVGFYSTFMVANKVEVISRRYDADSAYKWTSDGARGYTVEPAEKNTFGTTVILHLKDNTDDEVYDKLLDEYRISELVRKYSDYIRHPIEFAGDKPKVLNSMVPIWKKAKNQVKPADYEEFYKSNYRDFSPPLKTITASIEGAVNYNLLAFIPSKAPFDFYSKDFEKGLALYTNSVLIMQKCSDLLPDYLSFVRGLADSGDLSLNISRELLQQDRQLRAIAASLEKKLLNELSKMLKSERANYEKFFDEFGAALKYGAYDGYGANKDKLQDLLLFKTSAGDKFATLAEYTERLTNGQDVIYYAVGATLESAKRMPQAAAVISKDFEVLLLTHPMDEFLVKSMGDYGGKNFVNVTAKDILPQSDEDKEEVAKAAEKDVDLLAAVKEQLKPAVAQVNFSKAMGSFASCIRNDGEISVEMEKILAAMPGATPFSAPKILELNPAHPLIDKLKAYNGSDKDSFATLCALLLNQARIMAGVPLEDTSAFVEGINKLLTK